MKSLFYGLKLDFLVMSVSSFLVFNR